MSITPLPPAPAVTDTTSEFNTKAFNWVAALDTFTTETNAVAEVCSDAEVTASAALALVGAEAWVSGTTYAIGDAVYSPIDMQTYRRKTNGAGTTDPSADSTNWTKISLDATPATQAEMEAGTETAIRAMSPLRVKQSQPAAASQAEMEAGTETANRTMSPVRVKQAIAAQVPALTNSFTAVASGSISDGSLVTLNSDGTCSVVSKTNASTGSAQQFATVANEPSVIFDESKNKIVVFYKNNNAYAAVVVGTVSGSTISFGTPTVATSGYTYVIDGVYDSYNQKPVILYSTYPNYAARVCTISGTSVSFGAEYGFQSYDTSAALSAVFDTNINKIIVAYKKNSTGYSVALTVSGTNLSAGSQPQFTTSNLNYISLSYDEASANTLVSFDDVGNSYYGSSRVISISGTTPSFGTKVVFESSSTSWITSDYDAKNAKNLICYTGNGGGEAIVGTVSGTTISFGSSSVFDAAIGSGYKTVKYNKIAKKFIIAYSDASPTYYLYYAEATISGTSVSIGTPAQLAALSSNNPFYNCCYDSSSKQIIVGFNYADTSAGYCITVKSEYSTNELFVGISSGAYTNGQTATIRTAGAKVTNLTGLTTSNKYYASQTGTLTTSGTSDSYVGIAVSSTNLIVKG